jgi:cytochrome c oxidase subunit 4
MNDSHAHDVSKHTKVYVMVFVALGILTAVTVLVARAESSVAIAIAVALVIASLKASLVASYFMHLITEKRMIYWLLVLTGVLFLALLFMPLAAYLDQQGTAYVS